MARRRYVQKRTSRRSSGGMGGMFGKLKPVLAGVIGGVTYGIGKGFHAQFGGPAALGLTGYFMGNETLMTLSGIELSQGLGMSVGTSGGYL